MDVRPGGGQSREVEQVEYVQILQLVGLGTIGAGWVVRLDGVVRLTRDQKVKVVGASTKGELLARVRQPPSHNEQVHCSASSAEDHTYLRMSARIRTVDGVVRSPVAFMARRDC